jgi:hypothetical protein
MDHRREIAEAGTGVCVQRTGAHHAGSLVTQGTRPPSCSAGEEKKPRMDRTGHDVVVWRAGSAKHTPDDPGGGAQCVLWLLRWVLLGGGLLGGGARAGYRGAMPCGFLRARHGGCKTVGMWRIN